MGETHSESGLQRKDKLALKARKGLTAGALLTVLLTSCTEKTKPVRVEQTENPGEKIEYYTDFHVVNSKTKHEVHVKDGVRVVVYANTDGAGRGLSSEICITTKEHPEEIFSKSKTFGSVKYEIIYEK